MVAPVLVDTATLHRRKSDPVHVRCGGSATRCPGQRHEVRV